MKNMSWKEKGKKEEMERICKIIKDFDIRKFEGKFPITMKLHLINKIIRTSKDTKANKKEDK